MRIGSPTLAVTDAAIVWVALGSNLGDRLGHLAAADAALRDLSTSPSAGGVGYRRSPIYRSAALTVPERPHERQPDYLNAVARFATELEPEPLLDRLQAIEIAAGRRRAPDGGALPGERWAARPLDLDLLLYGDRRIASDRLQVPHPRIGERAFVLRPMLDVDPAAALPDVGPVAPLLARLGETDLERVEPR